MKGKIDKPLLRPGYQLHRIAVVILLVVGATLMGTSCVIVPVPSTTPDYSAGIIEEESLESLIGLDRSEVTKRMGYPDYSGRRQDVSVVVYQGETRYLTKVHAFVTDGYNVASGVLGGDTTTTLYCYVVELDADDIVRDFDIIVRPASGITSREDSSYHIEPAVDCSQAVWAPLAQDGVLPDGIEATKKTMSQREASREASEARRVALLEARA